MTNCELVIVVDFGGQFTQIIARRVRENNVYCEIISVKNAVKKIKKQKPQAIIFTGGPNSVYDNNALTIEKGIFELGIPILGICYGAQLITHLFGGQVGHTLTSEYGNTKINLDKNSLLFNNIKIDNKCYMSHNDQILQLPKEFTIIAKTKNCLVAGFKIINLPIYGVQFHPEVKHTPFGETLFSNFLFKICQLKGNWSNGTFIDEQINLIQKTAGTNNVICALSGGVDSLVAVTLVNKAIPGQLTSIFVDHGLLRKNERNKVEKAFKKIFKMNLVVVDAQKRFLSKLQGVTDSEIKRKIIGEEFIRIFEEEAQKIKNAKFLVQGTIYPDVVESGIGASQMIKSHHNVGGLPKDIYFKLIEPLKNLFKDEVREIGIKLGLPKKLVYQQPFPGPGLAIRILGEVTNEKLKIVQESDAILSYEVAQAGYTNKIWQYFTVLPNIKLVGVMGDRRTYLHTIVIRAISSSDGMTSSWFKMPYKLLETISTRIINEVKGVNRVVYDITSKPPALIEWE